MVDRYSHGCSPFIVWGVSVCLGLVEECSGRTNKYTSILSYFLRDRFHCVMEFFLCLYRVFIWYIGKFSQFSKHELVAQLIVIQLLSGGNNLLNLYVLLFNTVSVDSIFLKLVFSSNYMLPDNNHFNKYSTYTFLSVACPRFLIL